jgi:hypothetical protein
VAASAIADAGPSQTSYEVAPRAAFHVNVGVSVTSVAPFAGEASSGGKSVPSTASVALAVAVADPPPETETLFVIFNFALSETSVSTVMAG